MDVSLVSNLFIEDADMLTWPSVEDALYKSDCPKQLSDLPHHIAKDCLMNDQVTMMTMKRDGNASRATAEAALAMGAGRAVGLLSQAGADAFTRVRISVLQPSSTTPCSEIAFPYPTVQPRASLHFSSTSMDSDRRAFASAGKEAFNPCVCSKAATSTTAVASSRKPVLCPHGEEQSQQAMGFCSPPTFCPNQDVNTDNKLEHCLRDVSSLSGSAITALDKSNASLQTVDIPSSWESDLCTDKSAEEVSARTRKGQSSLERTERQSEVVHAAAKAGKPPSGRSSLMKRTRAAEIHNLSERKRRDKINLRMKALQELIPNANKTDKASLLDEAIEYMKLLQAQVQFMSMRTGMAVPPMMMPLWMQYFPHTGMQMGTSMGMAGDGTASDGSCIPVHGLSVSNPACYASQFQSSSTSSVIDDEHDVSPNCHLYEPYQAISCHQLQHPIQFSTQSNVHMFSPLVQLQHQTQENGGSSGI